MKKTITGILVGAFVYYVWCMISWMVLPWHNTTMKKLPEEQLIMDTLKTVITEPGFYSFPSGHGDDGKYDMKIWSEKFKKGPTGVVVFAPGGHEAMPPRVYIVGILSSLLLSSLGMMFLCLSRDRVKSIIPRALLIACGGILSGLAVHVPYWNWFQFPLDFSRVAMADTVISFFLMGFALSKFVPED